MARNQERPIDTSLWLTTSEASRFLGVSANTLRLWANDGVLRSYRTAGNHRRFHRSDLLAFLTREMHGVPRSDFH
ncbi:MAG: helix-turn-helix domain-containing protein [Chloroflexi bacterium]|nr:helix-turn-helix domain-containing protein [Chloroflexota bacterium]